MEIDDFKFNQPMSFVSPGAADGEYIVSEILEPPSQDISILASGHEEKITVQSEEHNTNNIDSYKILQSLQQSVYAERLERPPYALRDLIILAITCSPDKCMSVNSIKKFIQDLFLYYRHNIIWEQSVKLCLKRGKFRMYQCNCDPVMQTQGCYMSDLDLWTIDPHWADTNLRSAFTMSPSLKRKNREIQVEKNKMMKTSVEQDDISEEEVVFGDSPEEMTNNTIFLEDNNSHKFFGGNQRLKELFKELTEAEDCLSLIQPPPFTNSLFITLVLVSGTGDSFTTTQIVDTITQMFPYFAKCDKRSLRRSVLRTLSEKRKVFLKTSSEFDKEGSWNLRLSIDSVISILDKAADHIRPKKYLSLDKESSPMKKIKETASKVCKICHKSFSKSSNCKRHISKAHKKKSEKTKASSANQKVGAQVSSVAEVPEQDEIGLWERQDLLMPCNDDTPLEKKCKKLIENIDQSSSYPLSVIVTSAITLSPSGYLSLKGICSFIDKFFPSKRTWKQYIRPLMKSKDFMQIENKERYWTVTSSGSTKFLRFLKFHKEEVIHSQKSSHGTKDQGLAANPKKVGEVQEKFYVKSEPTDEEVIHIPKSSHDTKDQGLAANPKKVGEGQEKFYVKSEPTDEETDSSFEISFDSYDDETVYTDGCDEEMCKPEISQVSEEVNQSMSIVSAGCEGSEKSLEICQRSINDEDNIGGGSPEAPLLELKTAYVRIKRSLMLDTLAEDFNRRKNCRRKVSLASGFPCIPWAVENSIDPWKGWSAPSAELVKTRQSLQCIIDNTEKLLQLAFEKDVSVMSREKSATVSDVTEKTDHIATECVVEQPLGHNGMEETCSQKGFLGFDLDYWFGCWRGWQERDVQTSMKHRDHVRKLVRKMTLIQALEECEHTMDCTVQVLDDRRLQKCNLLQTSPQQNSNWKAKHQAMYIRVKQRLQEFLQSVQHVYTEPPFSYTVMLVMALVSVDPPCLPLSKIFQFIQNKFPFYQDRDTWKKSVCVTLSLNTAFSKTCGSCHSKSGDHDCCWQIDLDTAIDILARAFKLEPDEVPVIQQTESPNVLQEKVDRELKSPASKERVKRITEEKCHALLKADIRHRTSISRKLKTIKAKRRNGSLDENRQDNSRVNVQLQFEAGIRHRTSISRKLKTIKAKRRNGSLDENRQDNSRVDVQLQFETGDIHIPECFDTIQKKTNKKSASLESKEKEDSLTEVIKKQLNDLLQCVEVVTSEPPFSYTVLIVMALVSSEKLSLQLSEIYEFIKDKFPYYRDRETWQSSVKGTLQLNNFFSKACKSSCNRNTQNHDGCWKISPLTASEVLKRALETNRNKMEFMLDEECLVENKVVNQVILKRSPSPKLRNSDDVLQVLRLEEYLKINYSKFLENSRAILNIKEEENTSKTTDMSVVYNTVQLQDSLLEEHCDSVDNLTSKTDDSFEKYQSSDLSNTDPKEKSEIVNEKSTVDGEQSKCFESETNFTDYELKIVECYPNKKYDPPRLNKHQSLTKTFGTEKFICKICDKQFSCPFVLTQHKFSHSQIKTNPCYDCHEVFPGKEALIIHRLSEHTNEKNQHKKSPNCQSCVPQKDFECKFCVAVFPSKLSLDLHMENTHK